jgi:hypothetical protein
VAYYERPWLKQLRQAYAGQGIEWNKITLDQVLEQQVPEVMQSAPGTSTHNHHACHAAAGFQTSNFIDATVVVIDAIGEFDTISIWEARYNYKGKAIYKKLWGRKYPDSIGLMYSAMTKRVGLQPLDEEYILMGMSAYGKSKHYNTLLKDLIDDVNNIRFKDNLHIGVPEDYLSDDGKNFLQQAAKEAGFPPISNFDKPTKRDIHTLYRLAYPQDNGDKKTKVGELSDTFNDARDENLIRKMKKYEDAGYKVVSAAGYGHIDLIKNKGKV